MAPYNKHNSYIINLHRVISVFKIKCTKAPGAVSPKPPALEICYHIIASPLYPLLKVQISHQYNCMHFNTMGMHIKVSVLQTGKPPAIRT